MIGINKSKVAPEEDATGAGGFVSVPAYCRGGKYLKALIIIIIVLGIWGLYSYTNIIPASWLVKFSSNYQAVFLTNGQVYFGKLFHENSRYPVLRDIYYLQVTQSPQPIQPGQVPPSNINLVKLGGELHGPDDEMRINRDQILFVEDLRADSRVVAAIRQFQTPK